MSPTRRTKGTARLEGVKRIREWLNENRGAYSEMRKRLDSPKSVRRMLLNLRASCEAILAYNPMNEPHVAVFVVAEAQTNMGKFFRDVDFVELYEEKLKELQDLSKTADSEGGEEQDADPAPSG